SFTTTPPTTTYTLSLHDALPISTNGGAPVIGASITLALADSAVCTITNNDNSPNLTLVKNVTNDNGGTALANAWTLTAAGSGGRSEEHTSELQSRSDLVCRLLLE